MNFVRRFNRAAQNLFRWGAGLVRVIGLLALLAAAAAYAWQNRATPQHVLVTATAAAVFFFFVVPRLWGAAVASFRGDWAGVARSLRGLVIVTLIALAAAILVPGLIAGVQDSSLRQSLERFLFGLGEAFAGRR